MISLRTQKSVTDRRRALEKELGIELPHIGTYAINGEIASEKNCENMIGVTQIPLGIAGPLELKITTTHNPQPIYPPKPRRRWTYRDFFLPLATTEGALIASVNRGCKVIGQSGGCEVTVTKVGVTRSPVFEVKDESEAASLTRWIGESSELFQTVTAQTSTYAKYLGSRAECVGNKVFVNMSFDTGEAMGMNIVTKATTAIARCIESEKKVRCITVAGNFDSDKKPSKENSERGRGRIVVASVTIPKEILTTTLKTTARAMYEVWKDKCVTGSALARAIGSNCHHANIVAAMYIATGQDPAHVVEGSVGSTTTNYTQAGDLDISVRLPCIMVGSIGGGTTLETQAEAMNIIDSGKKVEADTLAKVVGGAVLAGEISLLASLSEGSLSRAHESLARGKKK